MKILDLSIFELEKQAAPQKNHHIISNSYLNWNLKFVYQNFEKINFSEIPFKNLVGFWQTWANFWAFVQDMLKMTVLPFSQHQFKKSHDF